MKYLLILALFAVGSFAENFGGIGVTIQSSPDGIQLITVIPGSPAEAVGLKAGDQILSVNGASVKGADVEVAKNLIRGDADTPVLLEVRKADGEIWAGNLQRKGLLVNELAVQDVRNWFQDASALSQEDLWHLASTRGMAGFELQGILQAGKLVQPETEVVPEGISVVYMGSAPRIEISAKPVLPRGGLELAGFDAKTIRIGLRTSGMTEIKLLDLNGIQVQAWNRDAGAGVLSLSWNGNALARGAYTLTARQGSLASSWEVVLP